MPLKPFDLNYHEHNGEPSAPHEVSLAGFLDAATVPEFETMAEKILDSECHRLILDLVQLSYISSAGIGSIMALLQQLRRKGGDMVLVQPGPRTMKMFELLGFNRVIEIVPDRSKAAEILGRSAHS